MKRKNTILLFITLSMALIGAVQIVYATGDNAHHKTTIKEVQQEVNDAAIAIKNYTSDKRHEATEKAAIALNSIDARINAMEIRIDRDWDNMNKVAREKARDTLNHLRRQRVLVAEKYGSLKHSSGKAWEHMKQGFSDSYEALRIAWEKAEKEY